MKTSKAFTVVFGFMATAVAFAQEAPAAELTVAQIIDKHIEATGGKAAYQSQKSLVLRGTVEMTGQAIKGTVVTFQKEPGKVLVVMNLPNIGEIRQGYDGKVAWSKDPFNGLQEVKGAEKDRMARDASNSILKWQTVYKSVEPAGRAKVGDRDTYKLKFTPKTGQPSFQYFDAETFLVLRSDSVQESNGSSVPVESYLSDYRTVGGIKMPFRTTMKMSVGEMVIQLTDGQSNVPIDDAKFVMPKKTKPAAGGVKPRK